MALSAFTAANRRRGEGCLDKTEFYGGCQDHVALLEVLFKALPEAVGIASSPVLINPSKANRLPRASCD